MKILKSAKWKDKLPGGLADNKEPRDYNAEQLCKGIDVEMEHTDDKHKATEIAMDHLEESKDYKNREGGRYYDMLERGEKEIKKKLKRKKQ